MPETDLDFDDLLEKPLTEGSNSNPRATYLGGNVYIQLPEAIGSLTPTARCILDELKDWHNRVDKQGGKDPHPSYLLTVDKLPESLNKFSNLSSQGKTEQAISQAIKQVLDLDRKGMNRVAYAYPYLIRNANKISSKITLIAPQKENKTDVSPFRQACFRYSADLIKLLISNRAKKGRPWEPGQPNILIQKNKEGKDWLYPKLGSIEAEIASLIRRGFGAIPPVPLPDFLTDCMEYARNDSMVVGILDDYHIVIDPLELRADGSFSKPPEVVNQILLQVQGLVHFCKEFLLPIASENNYEAFASKFQDLLPGLQFRSLEERLSCEGKAKELIQLIETFPFTNSKNAALMNAKESLDLSCKIIRKLLEEKAKTGSRQEVDTYATILKSLQERIPSFTRDSLELFPIRFEEEVASSGISDKEKIAQYSKRLKDDILSEYSYHEVRDSGDGSTYFIVDHGYMAAVLHKLTLENDGSSRLKKQLEYATIINDKLSNPKHPTLNGKLKPDLIAKLLNEIQNFHIEAEKNKKEQDLKNKLNVPFGIMAFFASALSFVTGAYVFESSTPVFFGIPFSVVLGILVAIFFREKGESEFAREPKSLSKMTLSGDFEKQSPGDSSSEKSPESKEDKVAHIYKSADNYVYPKKFNNVREKVLDPKSLKKRIDEHLDTIKKSNPSLASEKDNVKVASTIEYAVLQSSATIVIPDEVAVEDQPSSIIINRNDLKSALFRQQLADSYREEMEKKKFDKKLVKYYTFLINTIEMEFFKYLPKKK